MIQYITAGESHGKALTAIVNGLPAGIDVDEGFINEQLQARQLGYGRGGRMKIESDRVEILGGVRKGKTIGAPVSIAVWNKDWENWQDKNPEPVLKPRPGHADLTGVYKYDLTEDVRHILERSSARETAVRVAAGAIARLFLREFGIETLSYVVNWGGIAIPESGDPLPEIRKRIAGNDLRCLCDAALEKQIKEHIDKTRETGDTLGGLIRTMIAPMPPFLGSYTSWEKKLDARIARTVFSIQAMKGLDFGLGSLAATRSGSEVHDEIFIDKETKRFYRKTNNAGGIEGGMSNGSPIVFTTAMKPIPTLMKPLRTVDLLTMLPAEAVTERSDVTAVAAASVVIENCVAMDIAEALMERYGSDSVESIKRSFENDPALKKFMWK